MTDRKQLWRNIRQVLYNTISALIGAVTMWLSGGGPN